MENQENIVPKKSRCFIQYNVFCPTQKTTSITNINLCSKIARQLNEDAADINFENFPSINQDLIKRVFF